MAFPSLAANGTFEEERITAPDIRWTDRAIRVVSHIPQHERADTDLTAEWLACRDNSGYVTSEIVHRAHHQVMRERYGSEDD